VAVSVIAISEDEGELVLLRLQSIGIQEVSRIPPFDFVHCLRLADLKQ
jgi:hypothetical protein